MPEEKPEVVGVVLAGGLARRMGGGDKCMVDLGGRPLLTWIIERLRPQTPQILLNANGDAARFAVFGLPVISDSVADFVGPLAGVLAAMEWTKAHRPSIRWIASCAGDAPFIPTNLVEQFLTAQAAAHADLVCASSAGQINPVCGLWPISLADDLRDAVVDKGIRKVDDWSAHYRRAIVEFPADQVDPFFNINRPEDLKAAEALLTLHNGKLV